jgi:PBP1b-binding outer membrane lipoprotein LpoB
MNKMMMTAGLLGLLALGCSDKPHEYGQERPPVDQLDKRDSGLQSKDVVQASDQMAMDLLADPTLNASHTRWTIVVDRVENKTVNSRFDLDIFLERLKSNLAKQGKGRVQLIENRDKLRDLQSRELENNTPGSAPGPAGIQPDYSLYAKITELPNRGTSYYLCDFTLTDLRTRELAWTNSYEVRVAR